MGPKWTCGPDGNEKCDADECWDKDYCPGEGYQCAPRTTCVAGECLCIATGGAGSMTCGQDGNEKCEEDQCLLQRTATNTNWAVEKCPGKGYECAPPRTTCVPGECLCIAAAGAGSMTCGQNFDAKCEVDQCRNKDSCPGKGYGCAPIITMGRPTKCIPQPTGCRTDSTFCLHRTVNDDYLACSEALPGFHLTVTNVEKAVCLAGECLCGAIKRERPRLTCGKDGNTKCEEDACWEKSDCAGEGYQCAAVPDCKNPSACVWVKNQAQFQGLPGFNNHRPNSVPEVDVSNGDGWGTNDPAASKEQCIANVRAKCPTATIANYQVGGNGCFCQFGTNMNLDSTAEWESCLLSSPRTCTDSDFAWLGGTNERFLAVECKKQPMCATHPRGKDCVADPEGQMVKHCEIASEKNHYVVDGLVKRCVKHTTCLEASNYCDSLNPGFLRCGTPANGYRIVQGGKRAGLVEPCPRQPGCKSVVWRGGECVKGTDKSSDLYLPCYSPGVGQKTTSFDQS